MPFTMLVPAMNVFLPFRTVSLYLQFPGTGLWCEKGLSFSGKWFMTGLGDDFAFYILAFDGSIVMLLFRYSSSRLYLTLHSECFKIKQICFSCLTVYFDTIDVSAFVWFLFATFVWPFLRLMFQLDVLLIYLSHTYHVLVCCFLLSVFQSCFLAFLFLLFRYMLGLLGEYNIRTHRELPSSSIPVD